MLIFDAFMVLFTYKMIKELQDCFEEKDWLGFYFMIVILAVSLTGVVLFNVSYYGH